MNATTEAVRGWIAAAERVVVLTGAGISTDSGIPDFRGPQGVWTKNPAAEKLSTLQNYLAEPEVRKAAWRARVASPTWRRSPMPATGHWSHSSARQAARAHHAEHRRAAPEGGPFARARDRGARHHARRDLLGLRLEGADAPVLERVRAGEDDPPCELCGGILKSATISFGQALVPEVIDRAMQAAAEADLLLAVGTSLQVYPVAGAVPAARSAGAKIVIVNAQPTPFDDIADAVLPGSIGSILPAICD